MIFQPLSLQLAPDLVIYLNWAASTAAFVQAWQQRHLMAEALGTRDNEHLAEAASTVLSAVEQLNDHTTQVLTDLYRISHQLPAPGDKLLVGPLQLRVEERQLVVSHLGGIEQVAITYDVEIVRYRYEAAQSAPVCSYDLLLSRN